MNIVVDLHFDAIQLIQLRLSCDNYSRMYNMSAKEGWDYLQCFSLILYIRLLSHVCNLFELALLLTTQLVCFLGQELFLFFLESQCLRISGKHFVQH